MTEDVGGFGALIDADDAAKLLTIHSGTLLRWAREGRIPSIRMGRRVAFRRSQLNEWLTERYTGPAIHAAQPSKMEEQMTHRRSRYKRGCLTIEARKSGPAVWVYRWREENFDGTRVKRKYVVGSREQLPTRTSALKAVAGLRLGVNASSATSEGALTVAGLAEYYRAAELTESGGKTARTREVHLHQLEGFILPKWGKCRLADVKPMPVEAWLASMPHANGTKVKVKGVANADPIRELRRLDICKPARVWTTAVLAGRDCEAPRSTGGCKGWP